MLDDPLQQIRNNTKYTRGSKNRMMKFKQCLEIFSDIDASWVVS